MSRRHHGRPHHPARPEQVRTADATPASTAWPDPANVTTTSATASAGRPSAPDPRRAVPSSPGARPTSRPSAPPASPTRPALPQVLDAPVAQPDLRSSPRPGPVSGWQTPGPVPTPGLAPTPGPTGSQPDQAAAMDRANMCTAPQLRRFIKSRPYVPMHELRRRFAIDGGDDDVTGVPMDPGRIFVGLPTREGRLLGDLLRTGEIGYELSLDPCTPIVIGVYPMRPIPRP